MEPPKEDRCLPAQPADRQSKSSKNPHSHNLHGPPHVRLVTSQQPAASTKSHHQENGCDTTHHGIHLWGPVGRGWCRDRCRCLVYDVDRWRDRCRGCGRRNVGELAEDILNQLVHIQGAVRSTVDGRDTGNPWRGGRTWASCRTRDVLNRM